MSATNRCPQCGAPLMVGAAQAPCPACLMQLGLMAAHDTPVDDIGQVPELRPTYVSPAVSPPHAASKLPSPGDLAQLFPELEIIKLLGFGGMGAVYQARQTGLDRLVALKIIMPDVAGDPGFAERFTREARVLARLSHPHIVTIHDFGQRAGLHFLIMEYVDGVNLREVLNAGKMAPQEALRIIPRLCEALQYAHEEGIVHRDIKPENILIDRKGRVKVADFGLARLAGREFDNFTLTGTRQVVGTPRYMAPEQMQGSRAVDHRADIYSLGVVFYEMLTGEVPIGRFPPPSHQAHMDARLDDVVLRALDSNPDRRYQRVSEIQSDVESISQKAVFAPPPLAHRASDPASDGELAAPPTVPAVFLLIVGTLQAFIALGISILTMSSVASNSYVILTVIGLSLLGVVGGGAGLIAIAGAVHCLTTGSVRWLRRGAVLMLFPLNIVWLVGMPVGLWVLLATSPRQQSRVVRTETSPSAWELKAIAAIELTLNLAAFFLLPAGYLLLTPSWTPDHGEAVASPTYALFLYSLIVLATALAKMIMAIGYMAGGTSRWMWPLAILMAIPTTPAWVIEFPLGLWTIYVLLRDSYGAASSASVPVAAPQQTPPAFSPAGPTQIERPAPAPVSQQISAPWSGLGWVQKSVRRVPKSRRWALVVASLVILFMVMLVGRLAFSGPSLLTAAQSGNTSAVRFWLLLGSPRSPKDSQGMTPLLWAAWNRHPEVVRQLVAAGVDVFERGNDGETALMKAAYKGDVASVKLLLDAGSIVNDSDYDGETPLALAASQGHVAIVRELLDRGADPSYRTSNGWTALIAAANKGQSAVVSLLLQPKLIDAVDRQGETALMKAAAKGHQEAARLLIEVSADANLVNSRGETALTMAIAGGDPLIVDLLEKKMTTSNALLPLWRGFRAGHAEKFDIAIAQLKEAIEKLPSLAQPCIFSTGGQRYEIPSPELFALLLAADCENRLGHAKECQGYLQRALQKAGPVGSSDLYFRSLREPGHTILEQVTISSDEISKHITEPNDFWHLLRSIDERHESNTRSGSSSSSGVHDVKSLFKS